MENTKEIFIKCDCHAEAIEITYYPDDESFYLAFWDIGRKKISSLPWKKKISMIWKIIRGKDLYSDMIILNHDRAKDVANFINDSIGSDKKREEIMYTEKTTAVEIPEQNN